MTKTATMIKHHGVRHPIACGRVPKQPFPRRRAGNAGEETDAELLYGASHHERQDLLWPRAKRHPDANFMCSLGNGVRRHRVQPER